MARATYLTVAEASMADRIKQAMSDLRGAGTTMFSSRMTAYRAQPWWTWREEVQVDFGLGAPIGDGPSRSRRSWVFRMVLSCSRKAYSEAVLRQDTETLSISVKA
jgi:hypothetical protein